MRQLLLAALLTSTLAGCLGDGDTTEPLDTGAPDADALPEVRLLHQERFEGTAPTPAPGTEAFQARLPVQVPDGATRLLVTYNATYTGLWPSYVYLYDPAGGERANSGDDCDAPTLSVDVLESYSCAIEVDSKLAAGAWTFQMTWQVGEAAEQYTVDVAVWGTGETARTTPASGSARA